MADILFLLWAFQVSTTKTDNILPVSSKNLCEDRKWLNRPLQKYSLVYCVNFIDINLYSLHKMFLYDFQSVDCISNESI